MFKVVHVETRQAGKIFVRLADGVAGEVDLNRRLTGPMFEPLRDPAFFGRVFIDEFGVVSWPNGADLAPDALHDDLVAALG